MGALRFLIIGILFAILIPLGSALVDLSRGNRGDRLLRALTWRIALSATLFGLLLWAAHKGWIAPHGLGP